MRRITTTALFVLVAVAGATVLVEGASAQAPEFGRCLKRTGGHFIDSGCTKASKPGEERYEWFPGARNDHFTATNRGELWLVTVSGLEVKCTRQDDPGEYTGTKTVAITFAFSGCYERETKLPCESPGESEGTIVTRPLVGELGIVKRARKAVNDVVGLELQAPLSSTFAEYECLEHELKVLVHGATIGKLAANTMQLGYDVEFYEKPEKFEEGPLAILTATVNEGAVERMLLALKMLSTNEEAIEISTIN